MRRPTLVNQIDDKTCTHACLAMAAQCSVEDIIKAMGGEPLLRRQMVLFLACRGIMAQWVPPGLPLTHGFYFVSVPSLNRPRMMHATVLYSEPPEVEDAWPWELFDPQTGRTGREFYTNDDLEAGEVAYCEIQRLSVVSDFNPSLCIRGG